MTRAVAGSLSVSGGMKNWRWTLTERTTKALRQITRMAGRAQMTATAQLKRRRWRWLTSCSRRGFSRPKARSWTQRSERMRRTRSSSLAKAMRTSSEARSYRLATWDGALGITGTSDEADGEGGAGVMAARGDRSLAA